ncbi:MAG TPA: transposase [Candidatus Binatia bacterium]
MPNYRRANIPGGRYFFTVKTFGRQSILTHERYRTALRQAIAEIRSTHPFDTIAWVLLPDHLHAIWRMPDNDADFSLRWSLIKQRVTRQYDDQLAALTQSRMKRREGTLWQRRFWEHTIRDETDLRHHIDYIHYNPVKHGYVTRVLDWPFSTFHRYVSQGIYPSDWAQGEVTTDHNFGE